MFKKSILFLCLLPQIGFAQSVKTLEGKQFWFSFMENATIPSKIGVNAISKKDCKVLLSVPTVSYNKSITLKANVAQFIDIPISVVYNTGSENISNKGVFISSDNPLRLTGVVDGNFSRDQTMIMPWESIPNAPEYIVSCLQGDIGLPSQFCIISGEDNTKVKITPSASTFNGRSKGIPYFITLNKGKSYQVQALNDGDLSGTTVSVVESCNKIVLFMGNMCAVSDRIKACPTCDYTMDQAIPSVYWGKKFISTPTPNLLLGYILKITAFENNTTVKLNGIADKVIAIKGESIFYDIANNNVKCIDTDKPTSAYQISRSFYCNGSGTDLGDPSIVQLIPNKSFEKSTQVIFDNNPSSSEQYLSVVIPTGTFSNLIWNGGPPPPSLNIQTCVGLDVIHWRLNNTVVNLNSLSGLLAYQFGYFKSEAFASSHTAQFRSSLLDITLNGNTFCGTQSILKGVVNPPQNSNTSWDFGDGTIDTGIRVKHSYSKPGTYLLKVGIGTEDSLCGKDKIYDSIVILPSPIFDLGSKDTNICDGELLKLSYSKKKGEVVLWENGTNVKERTIFNPGIVKLTVTDSSGCTYTDSIDVRFDPCLDLKLKLYNMFSPGNDGMNDQWIIDYAGYETIQVKIFNRWSQTVYEYILPKGKPWNGKINNDGAMCPDGTYYYHLVLTSKHTRNITNVNGSITLIKEK